MTIRLLSEIQQLLAEEELSQQNTSRRHTLFKKKFAGLRTHFSPKHDKAEAVGPKRTNTARDNHLHEKRPQSELPEKWITLSKAAELTNLHRGTITRKADSGEITDNGKKGHPRKVEKSSVLLLMGKRLEKERQKAFKEYENKLDDIPNQH